MISVPKCLKIISECVKYEQCCSCLIFSLFTLNTLVETSVLCESCFFKSELSMLKISAVVDLLNK